MFELMQEVRTNAPVIPDTNITVSYSGGFMTGGGISQ